MPRSDEPAWIRELETRLGKAEAPAAVDAAAWLAQAGPDADPVLVRRMRLITALADSRTGRVGDGAAAIRDIREWAVEHREPYLQARTERILGTLLRVAGETSVSLEHAVASVELLSDDVWPEIRADHLVGLADALSVNGSVDGAVQRYQEALVLLQGGTTLGQRLMALNNLAYTLYEAGRFDEAAAIAQEIRDVNAANGLELTLHAVDSIASIYLALGRDADAAVLFESVDLTASAPPEDIATVQLTRSIVLRKRGDLDGARADLDACRQYCLDHGVGSVHVQALRERAELSAAMGQFEAAFTQYKDFHEQSLTQQQVEREARARMMQAIFETEEARRESARFREMSYRDALTQLYNRRYVDEHLTPLLDLGVVSDQPVAVAFVDLDHFKSVNDTYSHEVGDEVLRRLAGILERGVYGVHDGFAARMGGEEFLLVLPGQAADVAATVLERARLSVEQADWAAVAPGLHVTVSIGCATTVDDAHDRLTLLARADERLYEAKRSGRNRVVGVPATAKSGAEVG
ncbi:GGDEF domain-containing protein [Angustibacter luteus]|uniref:Diguanylate cyclase n=1 Tax=Angustibacter luteus TaxID=658456 RepID=A0ABW1J970_9ACTN